MIWDKTKLSIENFDNTLTPIFPCKISSNNEHYFNKITEEVFKIISSSLFDKATHFSFQDKKSTSAYINNKKTHIANSYLFDILNFLRISEEDNYKMNCVVPFRKEFYTNSIYSYNYYTPIIKNLIIHEFVYVANTPEIGTASIIKMTQKLIDIFNNTMSLKEIKMHFVNDDKNFIIIRNDNCEDVDISKIDMFKNYSDILENDKIYKLISDNEYFNKIFLRDDSEFNFSFNYYNKFLQNINESYSRYNYTYNVDILKKINNEIKNRRDNIELNITKRTLKINTLKNNEFIRINKYSTNYFQIYNNSDLTQGGRLYRNFVLSMPNALRRTLKIDDEETSCIDFSSLHPSLIYYYEFKKLPQKRIYDIFKYKQNKLLTLFDDEMITKIIKMIFVRGFNSKDETELISSIYYHLKMCLNFNDLNLEYSKKYFKVDKKIVSRKIIKELLKEIEIQFDWLYKHFYKNTGVKLFYVEFNLFIRIANDFYKKTNEYPFSIHDAFLFKKKYRKEMKESIEKITTKIFGNTLLISLEF